MGKHRRHSENFERRGKLESCPHGSGLSFEDATLREKSKKTSRSSDMSETPIEAVAHFSFSEVEKNKEAEVKEEHDSGSEILYTSFRSKKKSKKQRYSDSSVQNNESISFDIKELDTSAISNGSSLSETQNVKNKKSKSSLDIHNDAQIQQYNNNCYRYIDLVKVEKMEINSSRNSLVTSDSSNSVYEHSQSLLSRNITKALNSHNNSLLDLTQDSVSTDYSHQSSTTVRRERGMEEINGLLAGDSLNSSRTIDECHFKNKKKTKKFKSKENETSTIQNHIHTLNSLDGLQPVQSSDEIFPKNKKKKHRLNENVDLSQESVSIGGDTVTSGNEVSKMNPKRKKPNLNGNLLDLTQEVTSERIKTESRNSLDGLQPAQSSDEVFSKKKKKKHRINKNVDLTQGSVSIDGDTVTNKKEVSKINPTKKSKLNGIVPDLTQEQISKRITESRNVLDGLQFPQSSDAVFPKKKKKKHRLNENVDLKQESVSIGGDTVTSGNEVSKINPKRKKPNLNGNLLDLTQEVTSERIKPESRNSLDAQSSDEVFSKTKKKEHKINKNVDLTQGSVSIDGDTVTNKNEVSKINPTEKKSKLNGIVPDLTQEQISKRITESRNVLDGLQFPQSSDLVFPKKKKKKHRLNENDLKQESVSIGGDTVTSGNEVSEMNPNKKKKKEKSDLNVLALMQEKSSKRIQTQSRNSLDGLQPPQSSDEVFPKKKKKKHRLNENVDLTQRSVSIDGDTVKNENEVSKINPKGKKSKLNGIVPDLMQEQISKRITESRNSLDGLQPAQSSDEVFPKKKKNKHRLNENVDLTQGYVSLDGDTVTNENEVSKMNPKKKKKSELNGNVLEGLQPPQNSDGIFLKKFKKKHRLNENVNLTQEFVSLNGDTVTSENEVGKINPKGKKSKLNGIVPDLTQEPISITESRNSLDAQSSDEVFPKKKKKKHRLIENVDLIQETSENKLVIDNFFPNKKKKKHRLNGNTALTQESVSIYGDSVRSEKEIVKTKKRKRYEVTENLLKLTQGSGLYQSFNSSKTNRNEQLKSTDNDDSFDLSYEVPVKKKKNLNGGILNLLEKSFYTDDENHLNENVGDCDTNMSLKVSTPENNKGLGSKSKFVTTIADKGQNSENVEDSVNKTNDKKNNIKEHNQKSDHVSDVSFRETSLKASTPEHNKELGSKSKLETTTPDGVNQSKGKKKNAKEHDQQSVHVSGVSFRERSLEANAPKNNKEVDTKSKLETTIPGKEQNNSENVEDNINKTKRKKKDPKERDHRSGHVSDVSFWERSLGASTPKNNKELGSKSKLETTIIPEKEQSNSENVKDSVNKTKGKKKDTKEHDQKSDHVSDDSFRETSIKASTPEHNKELGSKSKLETTTPDKEQSNNENVEDGVNKSKGKKKDTKEHDQQSVQSDVAFRKRSLEASAPKKNKELGCKSKLETTVPDKEQNNSQNVEDSINKTKGKKNDTKKHDQRSDHVSDDSFRETSLKTSTPKYNKERGSKSKLETTIPDKEQSKNDNVEDGVNKSKGKKKDTKKHDHQSDRVSDISFRERSLEASTSKNNKELGSKSKLETTILDKEQSNSENVEDSVNKSKGKEKDTKEHDQKTIINGSTRSKKEIKRFSEAVIARNELLMTDDVDEVNDSYDSADDQSDDSLTENFTKSKGKKVSGKDSGDAYEYHLTEADKTVLQNLYIQVDFKVPSLHSIYPQSSHPTKVILEKVAENKIPVTKGKFTKEEDEILTTNWKEFVKKYKIEDKPCLFFSFANNKEKFLSDSNKVKFLQCLARGLDDRFLSTVYKRFKLLYRSTILKSGRFTEAEDHEILKYLKESTSKTKVKDLARILGRTIASLEKRIERLTSNKYERTLKWTKKRIQIYIKNLLIVTKSSTLEDLRHRTITLKEWKKLSKKSDGIPWQRLRNAWETCIYPRLFIEDHLDMRRVKMEVIEWMCGDGEYDWKTVNWDRYVSPYKGLTARKLYACIKTLVSAHIQNQKTRNDLGKSLEILHEIIRKSPSSIRTHYLNKLVYEDGVIKEVPGFKILK